MLTLKQVTDGKPRNEEAEAWSDFDSLPLGICPRREIFNYRPLLTTKHCKAVWIRTKKVE